MSRKIQVSEVNKKHLKILTYLLGSGLLGYIAYLYTNNPVYGIVFAKVVNYLAYAIEKELSNSGYREAMK